MKTTPHHTTGIQLVTLQMHACYVIHYN